MTPAIIHDPKRRASTAVMKAYRAISTDGVLGTSNNQDAQNESD